MNKFDKSPAIHKLQDLDLPLGMMLQLFPNGQYKIHYAASDIVLLRNWAVNLQLELTKAAVTWLEEQKQTKERERLERENKIKLIANRPNAATAINQQLNQLSVEVPIEQMEHVPLVPPLPPRVLNTNKGMMEVSGDISDDDLQALGINILPMPDSSEELSIETIAEPLANGQLSDEQLSDAPVAH